MQASTSWTSHTISHCFIQVSADIQYLHMSLTCMCAGQYKLDLAHPASAVIVSKILDLRTSLAELAAAGKASELDWQGACLRPHHLSVSWLVIILHSLCAFLLRNLRDCSTQLSHAHGPETLDALFKPYYLLYCVPPSIYFVAVLL